MKLLRRAPLSVRIRGGEPWAFSQLEALQHQVTIPVLMRILEPRKRKEKEGASEAKALGLLVRELIQPSQVMMRNDKHYHCVN